MEIVALGAAFVLGFVVSRFGVAPLVGYLIAGYLLAVFGFESSDLLDLVADLGVLLLLFAIGLKLTVRSLKPNYVWGSAALFAVVGTLLPVAGFVLLQYIGSELFADFDFRSALIVGLALSFSSTVFAVKALEETNEAESIGGRIAIGILILQDLVAVAFLASTSGTPPTVWALLVVPGFFAVKPLLGWVIDRAGHGELLILFGFVAAIGAGAVFDIVGLKSDLGALVAGYALSGHARAHEMADQMLGVKDLLLVGFFLSVGLLGAPPVEVIVVAAVVIALLPTRSIALIWLLTRFRLRGRTSLHTAITLSAYSEFGLVVTVAAVASGLLTESWVQTIGLTVAGSFIVASVANKYRYRFYDKVFPQLRRLERHPIIPEDAIIDLDSARILIFGMGRVGTGSYDELVEHRQGRIIGVEREAELVSRHQESGRVVVRGDALDRGFWERARLHPEVELVVAAMSSHAANLECARRVREFLPRAKIAAVAQFRDQVADLHEAGVDVARNLYEEAGQALAGDAVHFLQHGEDEDRQADDVRP